MLAALCSLIVQVLLKANDTRRGRLWLAVRDWQAALSDRRWLCIGLPEITDQQVKEQGEEDNVKDDGCQAPPLATEFNGMSAKSNRYQQR